MHTCWTAASSSQALAGAESLKVVQVWVAARQGCGTLGRGTLESAGKPADLGQQRSCWAFL